MRRFTFTDLPVSNRFSLSAATRAEAEALAERLGHETHDLTSLERLGVRIEEINFGDPSDLELAETDPGRSTSSLGT